MQRLIQSTIGLASACFLAFGANVYAQQTPNLAGRNWALGQANAPVTLLEYGSLTCGTCRKFHDEVLVAVKRRYIDTGQVRFIFRPSPTPPFDLAVGMHALTLCAGPSRYYPLVEAFFARQPDILLSATGETGPKGTIFAIAEDFGGLSYAASEACLRDPSRQAQVRASAEAGVAAGVTGTPTIFLNGAIVPVPAGQRHHEFANISQAIDAALVQAQSQARTRKAPLKAKKR